MAILKCVDVARNAPLDGKYQMTADEFKKWLMKFDTDKDGRISKRELKHAVRSRGGWFCSWKTDLGMSEADVNDSGYIDEDEIDSLLDFAERSLGFKFYY